LAEHDSFAELMGRLRGGDQDAAAAVFRRYAERLIGLARSNLDPRTRAKVDPEDVVQSAYRSFFTRHDAGRYDVSSWDNLWSLLTVITVRKCLNQIARFRADCRDVAAEVAMDAQPQAGNVLGAVINRDPTASEAAVLIETVEQLMSERNSVDRTMIELSLQGYSVQEISEKVDCSERTVRRLRERVRDELVRMNSEKL
jgi:RNA polymerase sigma-70 factor, ECF subfamily